MTYRAATVVAGVSTRFSAGEKSRGRVNRLVDKGHFVLVIEHNLDVIKTADYVVDLGPEGGHKGGELIACGTPEEIAACPNSHTGRFLKELLRSPGTGLA